MKIGFEQPVTHLLPCATIRAHTTSLHQLAVAPNGSSFFTAGDDGQITTIREFDGKDLTCIQELAVIGGTNITALAVRERSLVSQGHLAVGINNVVIILDHAFKEVCRCTLPVGTITRLIFLRDNCLGIGLGGESADAGLYVYDWQTWKRQSYLSHPGSGIFHFAAAEYSRFFATAMEKEAIVRYGCLSFSTSLEGSLNPIAHHAQPLTALAITPSGDCVASADRDGVVIFTPIAEGTIARQATFTTAMDVASIHFLDNQHLLVVDEGGFTTIDLTGKRIHPIHFEARLTHVTAPESEETVFCGVEDGSVLVFPRFIRHL